MIHQCQVPAIDHRPDRLTRTNPASDLHLIDGSPNLDKNADICIDIENHICSSKLKMLLQLGKIKWYFNQIIFWSSIVDISLSNITLCNCFGALVYMNLLI